MTNRWQEIEKLYHSALKHEPNGRVEFLKEACAGDEALRQEVESLLAQHVEAEDFIEEPALKVAAKGMVREPSQSLLGHQLGPYKILSLLGSGALDGRHCESECGCEQGESRPDSNQSCLQLPASAQGGLSTHSDAQCRWPRRRIVAKKKCHTRAAEHSESGRRDGCSGWFRCSR